MSAPVKYVCAFCGTEDVTGRDAHTRWSIELQRWEVVLEADEYYCHRCDRDLVPDNVIAIELDLKDYALLAQEGSLTPEQT